MVRLTGKSGLSEAVAEVLKKSLHLLWHTRIPETRPKPVFCQYASCGAMNGKKRGGTGRSASLSQ